MSIRLIVGLGNPGQQYRETRHNAGVWFVEGVARRYNIDLREDKNYFGVCADVITELGKTTPLLGVCLGMQGIVHCFGGNIKKAKVPMHGKISPVDHNGKGIFANIPPQLEVMRYHSLVADPNTLPDCLERTAEVTDENGETELMAVQHREHPITGIQFHPESFATEGGRELLANFLFQKA